MSFHIQVSETNHNHIFLTSATSSAKIVLNQGASLQELILGNNKVIENLGSLEYKDSYASAILFPFASRIKDGEYLFNNEQFQLEINEPKRNNAIHGLIYNKTFEIIEKSTTDKDATLVLAYCENEIVKGFPYTYKIEVTYVLSEENLKLKASFTNTSQKAFPFTYGWHPYFYSEDLSKSSMQFKSNKKVLFDDRMITKEIINTTIDEVFSIENKELDDCFRLDSNTIQFITPSYNLEIVSTTENGFLQVYTPPTKNHIAIEPVSGISDSFNNKTGLKELEPGKTYHTIWELQLINHQ
jgi:aldose 1-epimerase